MSTGGSWRSLLKAAGVILLVVVIPLSVGYAASLWLVPTPQVAVIRIEGDIWGFYTAYISQALEEVGNDPAVGAVVLDIVSPGGEVSASEGLYFDILRLREKKPVVASLGELAASGAYYVASAAGVGPEVLSRGEIYLGLQAQQMGLVDEIGSQTEAVAAAARQARLRHYRVVDRTPEPLSLPVPGGCDSRFGGRPARKPAAGHLLPLCGAAALIGHPPRKGSRIDQKRTLAPAGACSAGTPGGGALALLP